MFIDKRVLKDGSHYYSFSYNDKKTGRRIRLKKSNHPHFTEKKAATVWAKSQTAFEQSQKNLIAQKLEWKSQYFEFNELINKHAEWQKHQAVNSWQNNITWLEQYVLPWFLGVKKQNNVNAWHFLYNEFTDYLRDSATTNKGTKLAVSSSNKVIHTLNSFTRFLSKYNLLDPEAAKKCEAFPDDQQNTKSFDNVIKPEEFIAIEKRLRERHEPSADIFRVLYHTGLRSNEAFSLPMNCLFAGEIEGILHNKLTEQNIEYYGYLVLESQCADKSRPRDLKTHEIKRKPLKGRKAIHNKHNRVIPIRDKDSWNILASRHLACQEEYEFLKYGSTETNYLLFPDVDYTKLYRDLKVTYTNSSYKIKTAHDCRHSFCTYFVGETASFFLARAILGHKPNAFERYLHIYEAISLKAKQKTQKIQMV